MQLKWCLTLLATVLLAGSSANASIVIDQFTSSTLLDGDRPLQRGISGGLASNTDFSTPGVLNFGGFNVNGQSLTLTYTNITPGQPLSGNEFGYYSTLLLDVVAVTGSWTIDFITDNGSVVGTSKSSVALLSGNTEAALDLYNNDQAGSLNGLQSLSVIFTATSNGAASIDLAQISAVPEPTTMALLTPLMLGGVFYRRRKAKEADQSKI